MAQEDSGSLKGSNGKVAQGCPSGQCGTEAEELVRVCDGKVLPNYFPVCFPTDFLEKPEEKVTNDNHMIVGHGN